MARARPPAGNNYEDGAISMRRLGEFTPTFGGGAFLCALLPASAPCPIAQIAAPAVPASADTSSQPSGLSEGVVATVNDEMISTWDIVQRMRLLILTSGIQPTEKNLPALQQEAARSRIDERLELEELRSQAKVQKFDLIASDAEVNDELAAIARSNNTSADQLLAQLAAQGVGADTFKDQLRAEISWRGWIRGRYGSRIVVGDDQIKAYQKRLEAESGKPQFQVTAIFIDSTRAGDMASSTAC